MAMMMNPVLLRDLPECDCSGRRCMCGSLEAGSEVKYADLVEFPRVFAVDPGTHTGWACVWFDPDVLFSEAKVSKAAVAWQAGMYIGPEIMQVDGLMRRTADLGGEGLAVVIEDFVVRRMAQETTFLSPVRVGHMLSYGLWRGQREQDGVPRRRSVNWQGSSDAKGVVTDQRLKLWSMYLPGADHPRDATRHALLWIRRVKASGEDYFDQMHFVDTEDDAS